MTRIGIIFAQTQNGMIGKGHGLPWQMGQVPEDLQRFKRLTMGKRLIIGRKTAQHMPRLPGRDVVVLSRQEGYSAPHGWRVAHTLDAALDGAPDGMVWIAGGREVYQEALDRDLVHLICLSRVHACLQGDTSAPSINRALFQLTRAVRIRAPRRPHPKYGQQYGHTFEVWQRHGFVTFTPF